MNPIVNESLMKKGGFWFPEAVTKAAHGPDALFQFILIVSCILFFLIVFTGGYFIYKYRRTDNNPKATAQITHHYGLEIAWTVIPVILCLIVFYWGYKDFLRMCVPPANAMDIRIVARKWMWQFEYPQQNIKTLSELVVPVHTPVRLVMNSEDVIHSFYVPNFRIKRDVIPNRYTRIWFEAESTGNFQIFCAEYCGDGHSKMQGTVRVVTQAEFEDWLVKGSAAADEGTPSDQIGAKLYTSKGCNACHTLDGTKAIGPSWKGLYGKKETLSNGQTVLVNDAYIKESILDPKAKIVQGFAPVMNSFAGLLSEREITGIIDYIKTLK